MAMFEREHIFQSIIFGIHIEFPACNFIWRTSKYFCFFSLFKKKEDSNEDLNDFGQWKRKKWIQVMKSFWVRSLIKSSTRTWPPTPATLTSATRWGLQKHAWKMDISSRKEGFFDEFVCFNGNNLLNMKVIWDFLVDSIPSYILTGHLVVATCSQKGRFCHPRCQQGLLVSWTESVWPVKQT